MRYTEKQRSVTQLRVTTQWVFKNAQHEVWHDINGLIASLTASEIDAVTRVLGAAYAERNK